MPKVSVIIPTYNRGYIVRQAIESVLEQTFKDFEILIIDDGSTDNTREVIQGISDMRVKYLYKKNGGVANAINYGIANSKSEYIGILASDDLWPPEFLEIMKEKLDGNKDVGIAYTAVTHRYPDGEEIKSYGIERCVSGYISTHLFEHSIVPPMAVLIRRSIIPGFLFDENLKICEDNDAFLRLSKSIKYLFVPDTEVIRRQSRDSVTTGTYITGSYMRALSLERFYYHLDGDKYVPAGVARKKISHAYRRAAERHRTGGYRYAAIALYKKAIKYKPLDLRLYLGLSKTLFMNKNEDKCPSWQMPKPLGAPFSEFFSSNGNA
jgi:glycosyltransferase involved in cell wall biosynthesis